MQIVVCPACSTRIKIKSGVSGKFACPKCQKVLRVQAQPEGDPEETAAEAVPASRSQAPANPQPVRAQPPVRPAAAAPAPPDDFLAHLPPVTGAAPDPLGNYAGGMVANRAVASKGKLIDASTKSYMKKLGIGVAVLCLLILLTMPLLAYPRSAVCLVPIVLVALSVLGFVIGGRVWFIVLGFKQSVAKGFLVMLVPYYWLFFLAKNKQACIKPLVTIMAALAPGLMGVVIDTFFKPDFEGRGRSMLLSSSQRAQITKDLSEAAALAGPNDVMAVKFDLFTSVRGMDPVAAEKALTRLPGYIAGSFQLAADEKSVTFKYRGTRRDLAMRYAIVLPGEAGIMVNLTPIFLQD